ncbi:MAG: hypothetical protein BGN82_08480 [Alphaproteobacteria bacterium 65-7]|nr:MAG: hypothetical protein BGN82_08480 [Alphaproteobacteria bacterium 65-7]
MANETRPIAGLPLPRRTINALARGGITTLEQAAAWRDDELLSLPQCGPAAVAKLRALVACHTPSCTPSDPEISPCA